jgi:hypothetical protein
MADVTGSANGNPAVAFAVFAALMFDIISEACSSPQTAEINIDAREETLMKWVYIGLAIGGAFGIMGVALSPKGKRIYPALGVGMAAVIIWAQYAHARASGLAHADEGLPGTEQYAS